METNLIRFETILKVEYFGLSENPEVSDNCVKSLIFLNRRKTELSIVYMHAQNTRVLVQQN